MDHDFILTTHIINLAPETSALMKSGGTRVTKSPGLVVHVPEHVGFGSGHMTGQTLGLGARLLSWVDVEGHGFDPMELKWP